MNIDLGFDQTQVATSKRERVTRNGMLRHVAHHTKQSPPPQPCHFHSHRHPHRHALPQYSLLASFGFTSLFALTSLAAGRVADQVDRAAITTTACLVWAGATVATGFAPSFYGVLLFRIIQGVSQGFTNPAAFGILSDTVRMNTAATIAATAAITTVSVSVAVAVVFATTHQPQLSPPQFPPERRATANALFSSGIYIGGGLASLSVMIVGNLGWVGG